MRARGIETVRRILCVFPRYTSSFGTFEYAYPLTDGVQAFMPPQGLLLIAAYLPENWPVRFIDENIRPATKEDFEWAEAVFVSGMHIQRQQMNDICRRAHAFDLPVAIGGPSVSACPDYYPSFDYLHVGELGDATDDLLARLARDPSRPAQQVVLKTNDRVAMTDFPIPAYELAEVKRYFLGIDPVFERLSLSVRVLRHPRPLRPQSAAEDAAADHRRTRPAARMRGDGLGLFRRRQFHRQPQGRAGSAAAPRSSGRRRPAMSCGSPARRRSTSPSGPRSSR